MPDLPPPHADKAKRSALRLLLLTTDAALLHSVRHCRSAQAISIQHCRDPQAAELALQHSKVELVLIDEGVGPAALTKLVLHVREHLYKDWLPLMVLGGSEALLRLLNRRARGMVDYFLPKPFSAALFRERLMAARRLVSLRRVSKSALDRVSEGVIIIDEHGTLRSFNSAAERLFGWSADDVLGQNINLLMPPRHGHKHDRYVSDYLRSGQTRMIGVGRMETARRRDGSLFPMHLTVADISDDMGIRFVGVVRDRSADLERLELQQLALHDPLTGLPNRSQAEQRLRAEIERAREQGQGFAVLFVDLDRFKQVNDSFGHAMGDKLLCAVAQRLGHALSAGDFVARLAGDEFLLLLSDLQDPADAQRIAARVAQALALPLLLDGQRLSVTASIGVALYGRDGHSVEQLMARSDASMYAQKRRLQA